MEHKFGSVVLLGPPNAGKSTLLNQILGQKVAIVSPKPQTTRNRISGIWSGDDAQVIFLDTPGVHQMKGRMNRFLLRSAWNAVSESDVIVLMLDAALYAKKPYLFDKEIRPLLKSLDETSLPVLVVANKVDLVKEKAKLLKVLAMMGETFPGAEIFPVSSKTGEAVEILFKKILDELPAGPPMFPDDQISTVPLRFMASEIVREKLFLTLRQELPYTTAVEIEHWEEDGNLTRINAVIYTSRSNHKAMIIGKRGANLKRIGQEARVELEELLEGKVYLELWVKVRENWTEDPGFLRSLGFGE